MIRLLKQYIIFFAILILFNCICFAQANNSKSYPFIVDSDNINKRLLDIEKKLLDLSKTKFGYVLPIHRKEIIKNIYFHNQANFFETQFDSLAKFGFAEFDSLANFEFSKFDSLANFEYAKFHSSAVFAATKFCSLTDFGICNFYDEAEFGSARFYSNIYFLGTHFYGRAWFSGTIFDSLSNFNHAIFHSDAMFSDAQFYSLASFENTKFYSKANFSNTRFYNRADFSKAQFNNGANFSDAQFYDVVDFNIAQFCGVVDFRKAQFHNSAIIDFKSAQIKDKVQIGNYYNIQRFDFRLAQLMHTSKIIINSPVEIKIQKEKFKYISFPDSLNFFSKNVIINDTKQLSFKGDDFKEQRFELDYVFAKSTKYQRETPDYKEYPIYHIKRWWRFFYNATMGLGYRPFRLIWSVLILITIYTIFFYLYIPMRIDEYIFKEKDNNLKIKQRRIIDLKKSINQKKIVINNKDIYDTSTFIHCVYFSSMVFFTFRVKNDILTFFTKKEKRFIISEWILGFMIYVAFMTLSKSGSILHTLKSLFLG